MDDFRKLFWAAQYLSNAGRCAAVGLRALAAKQLTALLRFIGIVPADRAFHEAGAAWRAAGRPNMAFVLLNRYLDLVSGRHQVDLQLSCLPRTTFTLRIAALVRLHVAFVLCCCINGQNASQRP